MNYILFDDYSRNNLLPFTYTKPVCEIRIGILTIKEKWEKQLKTAVSYFTQEYLSTRFKLISAGDNILINGKISPNAELLALISGLENNSAIKHGNDLIAYRTDSVKGFDAEAILKTATQVDVNYISVKDLWDIFSKNGAAIKEDFEAVTRGRSSQSLSSSNKVIGDKAAIFLEEGAVVEAAILNTNAGPIYIGKNAEVMEGSIVRGPFSLGEHSALKLGTKIYGPTTVGPHSKVGGEVNNSVIFGYSKLSTLISKIISDSR